MSMLDGVSQCWWLSKRCLVDWEAWSAIGTVGAVMVALWLARRQRKQAERDQRSKGRWVALELRKALANWHRRVELAMSSDGADLYDMLEDGAFRNPTFVPAEIGELRESLHLLGDDLAPLADAVWLARQLSNMPVEAALRGDLGDATNEAAQVELFREGLVSLETHIGEAQARVSKIAGPSSVEDAKRIFRW